MTCPPEALAKGVASALTALGKYLPQVAEWGVCSRLFDFAVHDQVYKKLHALDAFHSAAR